MAIETDEDEDEDKEKEMEKVGENKLLIGISIGQLPTKK